jgi:hypothetical protein
MKGGETHSGKKEKSSQNQEEEKVRGLITSNREPSRVVVPGFLQAVEIVDPLRLP